MYWVAPKLRRRFAVRQDLHAALGHSQDLWLRVRVGVHEFHRFVAREPEDQSAFGGAVDWWPGFVVEQASGT